MNQDKIHAEKELCQVIIEVLNEKKPQTVEQLASLASEKARSLGLSATKEEAIECILRLQSQGRLSFVKQYLAPPLSLTAYLKSEQALWYWLIVTTAIAATAVVFILPEDYFPWIYVRYIISSIFVLWLPGYSFTRALFPERVPSTHALPHPHETSEKGLDILELVTLSVSMSLALVLIVGFLLSFAPWGIGLTSIVPSLLSLTMVLATAAVIREHQAKTRTLA